MTTPTYRLAGVELEPWEIEIMERELGPGTYSGKHLDAAGDIGDPEILTVFIYSPVTSEVLKKYPSLKMIATLSTGYDHIDLTACHDRGIIVSNVPSYGENTVAEQAFALLLALTRKIVPSVNKTRQGDFTLDGLRGVDLHGKTFGVIGTGRIGQHAIRMAKGFGMNVIAFDAKPNTALAMELGYTYHSLEDVLKLADVVSLHAPALPSTLHMMNEERLRLMKPTAYLINTARGTLVDTQALVRVLESGHLAGVGLDVLEEEKAILEERQLISEQFARTADLKTMLADHALLDHPRVIITPHNAFNTREALERILRTTIDNVKGFIAGTPTNVVT